MEAVLIVYFVLGFSVSVIYKMRENIPDPKPTIAGILGSLLDQALIIITWPIVLYRMSK
jgi:hypothetical protein